MLAMTCVANASLISTASRSAARPAGALEDLLRRRHRAEAHDVRRHAGRRGRDDAPARRQAVLLDRLLARDDDRARAVRQRRRGPGRDDAAALERRVELRERLGRRVRPRHLVLGQRAVLERHARRDRARRCSAAAAVRCCERRPHASDSSREMPSSTATSSAVSPRLIVALPPSTSRMRGFTSRQPSVVSAISPAARPRPRAGFAITTRRAGHRLDAAGDDDVGLAGADLLRGRRDRLQARRAQPVDGVAGDLVAQAGEQDGHARDVAVVLARLVGGAEDDLVDRVARDARAVERGLERRSRRGRRGATPRARRGTGRTASGRRR